MDKPNFQIQRKRRAQWREEHAEEIKRMKTFDLELLATTVGLGAVIGGTAILAGSAVNGL